MKNVDNYYFGLKSYYYRYEMSIKSKSVQHDNIL